jgi:hypothetical protein
LIVKFFIIHTFHSHSISIDFNPIAFHILHFPFSYLSFLTSYTFHSQSFRTPIILTSFLFHFSRLRHELFLRPSGASLLIVPLVLLEHWYVHTFVHVHVYMYVNMYVYTYTLTHTRIRHTHTCIRKNTNRQTFHTHAHFLPHLLSSVLSSSLALYSFSHFYLSFRTLTHFLTLSYRPISSYYFSLHHSHTFLITTFTSPLLLISGSSKYHVMSALLSSRPVGQLNPPLKITKMVISTVMITEIDSIMVMDILTELGITETAIVTEMGMGLF